MRNWLKYAAVMSVVGLVAAAYAQEKKPMVNYAAEEKLGWKLAAQAYTFGRNGVSLYDTIAILKDLGIKYVELFPGQLVAKGSDVKVGPDMPADWAAEIQIVLKQADVKAVAYGVTGIPTSFVIDQNGIIRFRHIGYRENLDALLARELDGLLQPPQPGIQPK